MGGMGYRELEHRAETKLKIIIGYQGTNLTRQQANLIIFNSVSLHYD